ncbi:hypothetical protein [Symbiopectobacterium sp. RP]|uniref:hypothetical protein n=1 Tax=Symbiopectobacterium sp. RP TaxID=3248553 RepID=UPI003D26BC29
MITANALICGKKIQLIVIKIMSLGYMLNQTLLNSDDQHGHRSIWRTHENQTQ